MLTQLRVLPGEEADVPAYGDPAESTPVKYTRQDSNLRPAV
jgi:hypothetical protein